MPYISGHLLLTFDQGSDLFFSGMLKPSSSSEPLPLSDEAAPSVQFQPFSAFSVCQCTFYPELNLRCLLKTISTFYVSILKMVFFSYAWCSRLNCVSLKFICGNPNPQNFTMWLYLGTGLLTGNKLKLGL